VTEEDDPLLTVGQLSLPVHHKSLHAQRVVPCVTTPNLIRANAPLAFHDTRQNRRVFRPGTIRPHQVG
jgi:hypothetical protein